MIGIKLFKLVKQKKSIKEAGQIIRKTLLKYPINPLSVNDIYNETDGKAIIGDKFREFYKLFDEQQGTGNGPYSNHGFWSFRDLFTKDMGPSGMRKYPSKKIKYPPRDGKVSIAGLDTAMTNAGEGPAWIVNKNKFITSLREVFSSLLSPDCVKSYNMGIKNACKIRTKEGYIINNTLAQLNKDVKYISKLSIKEKIEKKLPCIFADVFDEYENYSLATDPLMNWYDITNDYEKKQEFGSILRAMCILKNPPKPNQPYEETKQQQIETLKNIKFVYTTVLNETFIMKRGDKPVYTPAGNYIYVNNQPTPPYVNIGKFLKDYNIYKFYKNDPRENSDKKKNSVIHFFDTYFNLLIKLMTYELYQDDVIKIFNSLANLQDDDNGYNRLIHFKNTDDFYDKFSKLKEATVEENIEIQIDLLINKIKNNNNATYIGTIQSTEEVNRISDKIILSEEINKEKLYSAMGRGNTASNEEGHEWTEKPNINNYILRAFYNICYLQEDRTTAGYQRALPSDDSDQKKIYSAIKYEMLYIMNVLTYKNKSTKRALSMKEKDIETMTSSLENVFPIATRFMDYRKVQTIWEKISNIDRGNFVVKYDSTKDTSVLNQEMEIDYIYSYIDDSDGEWAETERSQYPYTRDVCLKQNFNNMYVEYPAYKYSKKGDNIGSRNNFDPIYKYNLSDILEAHIKGGNKDSQKITNIKSKLSVTDLTTFNDKLQEIISMEPSPSFVTNKIFSMYERSCFGKVETKSYQTPPKVVGSNTANNQKKIRMKNAKIWYGKGKNPARIVGIKYGPYSFDNVIPYNRKDTDDLNRMKGFQRFPTAYDAGDKTTCITENWTAYKKRGKDRNTGKDLYDPVRDYLTYYKWFNACNVQLTDPKSPDYKDTCRDPMKIKKIPKIKYGLLRHIVQDDFFYEVYQRYIPANFQFNFPVKNDSKKGNPRSEGNGKFNVQLLKPEMPEKQGYLLLDGPKVPPVPTNNLKPKPRGYVELKPAYFKSEIFNIDKEKAYDRSVFNIDGQGNKQFNLIGGDGPNPFRLSKKRYCGVGNVEQTGKYGNELVESKLVDIEEHAWALFCEPVTMKPTWYSGDDGDLKPFANEPVYNVKIHGEPVYIWGWAPTGYEHPNPGKPMTDLWQQMYKESKSKKRRRSGGGKKTKKHHSKKNNITKKLNIKKQKKVPSKSRKNKKSNKRKTKKNMKKVKWMALR